jgi:hypothetical protein
MEGYRYQSASAFSVPIRALTVACYQYDSGFKKTTHQLNGRVTAPPMTRTRPIVVPSLAWLEPSAR